jgi:polyhydroxyalkanoate synthesis regulator phasin
MPKKKNPESQGQQSERFKQAVRDLVDAGELNPTDADAAFERIMDNVKVQKDTAD